MSVLIFSLLLVVTLALFGLSAFVIGVAVTAALDLIRR